MADLVADISEVEKTAFQGQKDISRDQPAAVTQTQPPASFTTYEYQSDLAHLSVAHVVDELMPPSAEMDFDLLPPPPPPPPTPPPEPLAQVSREKNLMEA